MPSADIDIRMFGHKSLQRKLIRLTGAVQKRIINKALKSAAKVVQAKAKQNVTVKSGKHSIPIRKSIVVRKARRTRRFTAYIVRTGIRGTLGISEGGKFYYPAHVELGAVVGTKRLKALPYIRPALVDNRQSLMRMIRRSIWGGIKRESRKSA